MDNTHSNTRDAVADSRALRVNESIGDNTGTAPLGNLIMHMFTSYEAPKNPGDFLRRFLVCLHDDLQLLSQSIDESNQGLETLPEMLHRHAERCLMAIELQDRFDQANRPASPSGRGRKMRAHLHVAVSKADGGDGMP
jgi:hypothetical protein